MCSTCRRAGTRKRARAVHLQEHYDLTPEEYDAIFERQNGVCAICKGRRPYNLHVDHDHAMEKRGVPIKHCVRGLLCKQCNKRLLPAAKDNPNTLMRAATYVARPPAWDVLGLPFSEVA